MPPPSSFYQVLFLELLLRLFVCLSYNRSNSLKCLPFLCILNNNSILIACIGEVEKPCVLILVDDTEHEEDEELRLVLGSPKSESPFGASIGAQNETLIKIKDDADSKTFISHFLTFLCLLVFHLQLLLSVIVLESTSV